MFLNTKYYGIGGANYFSVGNIRMIFVYMLATFGLAHFIKESDFMNWPRIQFLKLGPIFYKLLECYFCLGFWTSLVVYSLTFSGSFHIIDLILWGFSGATVSFLVSSLIYHFRGERR